MVPNGYRLFLAPPNASACRQPSPSTLQNRRRQPLGARLRLGGVLRLDHHAHQRLGAAGADQHAAGAGQFSLNGAGFVLQPRVLLPVLPGLQAHVDERLREQLHAGQLLEGVALYPQTLVNVRLQPGQDWQANPRLPEAVRAAEAELAGRGRVLIRASGTDPLVRVMVEAQDAAQAQACAERLAATILEG